jgi:phenylacetate-CoA ligase
VTARAPGETRQARVNLGTRGRNSGRVALATIRERRIPYWSSDRMMRLQNRRVHAIVSLAYETVPFYRETMRKRGLEPDDFRSEASLGQLPIVEPSLVQDDPERFTSSLHGPGRRWAFHTSGSSTGLRRVIYRDNRSLLLGAACDAARPGVVISRLAEERWAGVVARTLVGERDTPLRRLLAVAIGSNADHRRLSIFPINLSSRTMRSITSEQTFIPGRAEHHEHLSPDENLEQTCEILRQVRPRVIFSFGSYCDGFFRALNELEQPVPMPRVWAYAGDMVSPETSDLAERFGCQLYSIYSAVDGGPIGFQCERRCGFHLNVDHCAVRLVDEDGERVSAGQPGDIIVSNLDNRAMVLLNLRIGDRGELAAKPCACGRTLPVLARLEGRRSDNVTLADGRVISSLSMEGLFRAELRQTRQGQIVQIAPGDLRWRVVPFKTVDQTEMRRALLERAREVLGASTCLDVEFVDEIAKTGQGKLLHVVSGSEHLRRVGRHFDAPDSSSEDHGASG